MENSNSSPQAERKKGAFFFLKVAAVIVLLPFSLGTLVYSCGKPTLRYLASRPALHWNKSEVMEAVFFNPSWMCGPDCSAWLVVYDAQDLHAGGHERVYLFRQGREMSNELRLEHGDLLRCRGYFNTNPEAWRREWSSRVSDRGAPAGWMSGSAFEVESCRAEAKSRELCDSINLDLWEIEMATLEYFYPHNLCHDPAWYEEDEALPDEDEPKAEKENPVSP